LGRLGAGKNGLDVRLDMNGDKHQTMYIFLILINIKWLWPSGNIVVFYGFLYVLTFFILISFIFILINAIPGRVKKDQKVAGG